MFRSNRGNHARGFRHRTATRGLNSEIVGILNLSDVGERFASLGTEPVGSSPAEFAAHVRKELPKYAKVVKKAGMRVD